MRYEYWITERGDLLCADDGDTLKHEGHALEHVRRELFDCLGIYSREEFICDTVLEDELYQFLRAKRGYTAEQIDDIAYDDWLKEHEKEFGLIPGLVDAVYDRKSVCLRSFVMENYGWVWCRKTYLGAHCLDEETVTRLRKGVWNILDYEGDEPYHDNVELTIRYNTPPGEIKVTIKDLLEGDSHHTRLDMATMSAVESKGSDSLATYESQFIPGYYKKHGRQHTGG